MKILITGISGRIGRLVATTLLARGHQVIGIDRRAWHGAPEGVTVHRFDIRKRGAEDVFRTERPDGVVHLATVTHLGARSEDRYRINLQGTRAVFDHSRAHGARAVVFVGRHTFYGAGPESPLYHSEDDPPSSVNTFPELSDLVAADLYAGSALWRMPEIDTAVLRVCYTLGPARHGTLAAFLRGPRVPTILGFDPLFQFLHEDDVAAAIALTCEHRLRGVFNVAGLPPMPLSVIVRETGRTRVPVPLPLFRLALGRFGMPNLPPGALSHIQYPVIMDASAFSAATGFVPRYDEAETMRQFRES